MEAIAAAEAKGPQALKPEDNNPLKKQNPLGGEEISSEHFLQLLVTQLKNQDFLNPMKNEEFLAQLAQFTGMAEQREQSSHLEEIKEILTETQGQIRSTQELVKNALGINPQGKSALA